MGRLLTTGIGTALAFCTLLAGTAGAVTLKPGDILVADFSAATDFTGAIIKVDPRTGKQTLVSDNFQAVNTGDPLFTGGPTDVDVLPNGRLVVIDYNGDKVLFVNPANGDQSLIYEDPTQAIVNFPIGGVRAPNGRFVFAAEDSDPANGGAVLSLNLATRAITTISNNDDPLGGTEFSDPTDLVFFGKHPLVADDDAGPMSNGAILQVNAGTGVRSTFAADDSLHSDPRGILRAPNRKLFISDEDAFGGSGSVFTLNPRTRAITELASNPDPGPDLFGDPDHLAVELSGRLLVADRDGPSLDGAVIGVDPRTGAQSLVSDNAQAVNATSQLMKDPFGIAVVPPKCAGQFATIVGSSQRDKLKGTPFPDVIAGAGGNDVLRGLGRKDRLCGGRGRDRLIGGSGRDRLRGGPGRDFQRQ